MELGGPFPGVVVPQEAWGVDGHIPDLVERFASADYVASAPDLYQPAGVYPSARPRSRRGRAGVPELDPAREMDDDPRRR
jgi:carboxymethylenebutenolidase